MRIELDLTEEELDWLQAKAAADYIKFGTHGSLSLKITRAIERAESFVVTADDMRNGLDIDGNEPVVCAGCNGTGEQVIPVVSEDGTDMTYRRNCYYCSGTGKEWV